MDPRGQTWRAAIQCDNLQTRSRSRRVNNIVLHFTTGVLDLSLLEWQEASYCPQQFEHEDQDRELHTLVYPTQPCKQIRTDR